MRELATLAVTLLLTLPDGATAFFGRRRLVPCPPPPVAVPVCPPVVLVPPCLPPVTYPVVPTTVVPATPAAPTPSAEPPKPKVTITPREQPTEPPVRPATEATPRPVTPVETRPPSPTPLSDSGFTMPELRPPTPGRSPVPGLTIPPTPVPGGRSADPAPKDDDAPPVNRLKPVAPGGADELPPLSLPSADRIARSSPIRSRPAYQLFPTADQVADDAEMRVAEFTNLTGKPVTITVAGATGTLPDRTTRAIRVPREFGWSIDDGRTVTTTVPGTARGVDIVLNP